MEGFPVTYRGFDGVEYRAEYKPVGRQPISRYSIERVDGQPITVGGRTYPAGFIGGYGDAACKTFLLNLARESVA